MSNANKVAIYLTAIDSAPSYAINTLVAKPIAVATAFLFFLCHTLFYLSITITILLCVRLAHHSKTTLFR